MTNEVDPLDQGPDLPVEEKRCIFCGDEECEWAVAIRTTGVMGWHRRTLTGQPLPWAVPLIGAMIIMTNGHGELRPRFFLPMEIEGRELGARLRGLPTASHTPPAPAPEPSRIILATR